MDSVSLFEARELIRHWARLFDAHAAPRLVYDIVAGEDFTIRFGDTVMRGLAGLEEHHLMKAPFFDEQHLYYDFQVEFGGPPLVLTTQMVWECKRRLPDGGFDALLADLRHRWIFTRNPHWQPVFLTHELISLNYRPGYAPSENEANNLHLDSERVGFGK